MHYAAPQHLPARLRNYSKVGGQVAREICVGGKERGWLLRATLPVLVHGFESGGFEDCQTGCEQGFQLFQGG